MSVKSPDDLIESCWPEAYRIAYSVLQKHADAEDAAQDACAQLYVALPNLRDERAFKRWFFRIAVRKAYDVLRRRRPQDSADSVDALAAEPPRGQSPDLRDALERLPRNQRLAVIFRYYYGFPDAEIAQILGTTHAAVRVRLFSARRSLKRLLLANPAVNEGTVCHERS